MRTGLCGIIAGLSDIDARVASFLAAYAIRSGRAETAHAGTEIPLAREDVADHLLVNPDTLSRAYTRLRDLGVLGRSASSRPLILNWEGLLARTPIADLLVKTLRRPPW
jgi:CRP-like cAMP-binding protein